MAEIQNDNCRSIKNCIKSTPDGLTNKEAYEKIIEQNLYNFQAKKPENVVNSIIRRHCYGLDFLH